MWITVALELFIHFAKNCPSMTLVAQIEIIFYFKGMQACMKRQHNNKKQKSHTLLHVKVFFNKKKTQTI